MTFANMTPRSNYTGCLSPWLDKMIAWQQQGRSALEIARLLLGEGVKTHNTETRPPDQVNMKNEVRSIASIVRAALKPPKTLVKRRNATRSVNLKPSYITVEDLCHRAQLQDDIDSSDVEACLGHARELWTYNQKGGYTTPHMYRFIANDILAKLAEPEVRAFLAANRDIAEYIAGEGKDLKIADAMNAIALACIK